MALITVGIPCYTNPPPEVLDDYMRFAFYLGRRYLEHDFFLAIKSKTEQFRARNAIVRAAQQVGSNYLLMLDDDHIIDIEHTTHPAPGYEFLRKLLSYEKDIVGALYYQRGNECLPVAMKEVAPGRYEFLKDHELTGGLQKVDVVGGGCMLINMRVFDFLEDPYFRPELDIGTDMQVCENARKAGFEVWLDSSIEIGHLANTRQVVTSRNRHMVYAQTQEDSYDDPLAAAWYLQAPLNEYMLDACEWLGVEMEELFNTAGGYNEKHFHRWPEYEDKRDYYLSLDKDQLCRQVGYHYTNSFAREMMEFTLKMLYGKRMRVLDFACGSAPVGFELARQGCDVTFVDIDGCSGFEFLKWRLGRHRLPVSCVDSGVFDPAPESYDCILFMDAIEHFENWTSVVDMAGHCLKDEGAVITNYFMLGSHEENLEHCSMDKEAVMQRFVDNKIYPLNQGVLIKNPAKIKKEG